METAAWLRVLALTAVYLVAAVSASVLVRRTGADLREMEARTSAPVLAIGVVANLVVLLATLLFLTFVDGRPIAALGVGLSRRDALFTVVAVVVTFASAAVFVRILERTQPAPEQGRESLEGTVRQLLGVGAVLVVVAAQEEVLYRGYVTVNLRSLGVVGVLIASTGLFTVIHFLTNRVSPPQVASWAVTGAMLEVIYLVTGTIWVPIVLHFVIDLTNVLVFDIAGKFSPLAHSRAVTVEQRAGYRFAYVVAITALALVVYGPPTTSGMIP